MDQQILTALLTTVSVGGVLYALLYPYISSEAKAQKRAAVLLSSSSDRASAGGRSSDPAKRRKAIAESLKDVDANVKKKATLEQRIAQAGLSVTREGYMVGAAVCGLLLAFLAFVFNGDWMVSVGAGAVGAFGLPNWILSFLRKRRIAKFNDEFPNSIEIIIRGVKAGLPVADCFRIIASEGQEPVRSEFKKIVESTAIGLSIGEGCERFAERVPVPEASFFSIVINIQQKAGGNLSEALTNLASVLRDRKRMKGRVRAVSSEAKSSAGIIGSLPFIVGGVVYLSTPAYIMILFTTFAGKVVVVGGLLWMSIGVFIMKKMIEFDF